MSEEGIIITPDKVVLRTWNGDKKRYQRRIIKPKNLPFYCWEPVSIEGDVSLGRIFSLIEANKRKWELLLRENLEPFLEEAQKPTTENKADDMVFLEIYWSAETTIYKGKGEFYLWPCLQGVGYASEDDKYGIHKKGEKVPYAIEFVPVNNLVRYPIKLDENVQVLTTDLDAFEASRDTSCKETELGNKPFTLLELFKGIFWEIAFLGSPENRDQEIGIIRETMEDIKNGDIETIPWENIKKKIDENNDLKDLLDEGM